MYKMDHISVAKEFVFLGDDELFYFLFILLISQIS